jgi:DNA repair exonuclease SbcCD ATPase subunit
MALEESELKWLEESWENLSKEALNREMSRYAMEWNTEKVQALIDFIKSRDGSDGLKSEYKSFKDEYDEFQKSIDEKNKELADLRAESTPDETKIKEKEKEIKEAWEKFFRDDMKKRVEKVWDAIDSTEKAKDDEINRLKDQLSWIVSNWPKLSEYFSIKRRRLVTLNSNIRKLEKDKENYPKNVLIYLMWLSNSKVIWIRNVKNGIKRSWMRVAWHWNSDDIKENLRNFEDSIKVNPWESEWTKGLKKQLQEHLQNAKQAYINKQKKSVGL